MDICDYFFRGLGWLVNQPSFPRIGDQEINQLRWEPPKDETSELNGNDLDTALSKGYIYLFLTLVTTLVIVICLVFWARRSGTTINRMRTEIMEDIERAIRLPPEDFYELAPKAVAPESRP
ncbi:hypothetical protein NW762_008636 [Fusarium torreyae]|uniref:Uncharacterized protein n=1 Tax=Fusarium torreyae TaxID=1237075 RepID=A0A9W8RVG2_9HYPO|nr:hypothetical protein NW762_008636 [Fusarium torreyae]